ncbi:hypothetical protein HMPREF1548_04927 [Clostridium sp. KLE 1755]|nr:hypothetical protein HMPREF1548_04927 [Clostridium sp. KLE 1755]
MRSSAALTAEGEKYTVRNIQFLRLTAQNRHLPRTPDGWDRAGKSPGAKPQSLPDYNPPIKCDEKIHNFWKFSLQYM